jgi:DNA-binding CsgD family transcriptional regulator
MPSRNGRRPGDSPRAGAKRTASAESSPLTKRELEVVEWIAEGKRNREIGEILGCSERTVQKHVQHILEKLHMETRTAVCIWCFERRLEERKVPRPERSSSRG